MIDIVKAKQAFKEYVKEYDINDKKIELKVGHIERTAQMARKIAESLNLKEEDIQLAELIGLLHDIGRFEQIRQYNTFLDKDSINHAVLGVEILFEQDNIRKFIEENKYDEIIRKAILNHNKGRIEEGLNERELLHAKIIRDADKTDIIYMLTFYDMGTLYESPEFSDEIMSDEIYREFIEDKIIDYKYMTNSVDNVIAHLAYIYDFYFEYGLKYIYDNKYLPKFYNRFSFKDKKTSERFNNAYKIAINYIQEELKIDNNP